LASVLSGHQAPAFSFFKKAELFIATRRLQMATGTVKWFNPTKGYGFVQPDQGGADVFVHVSAVERAGLATLNEGQKVSYELVSSKGKTSAGNLKVIG
jgi:CspA family cold shock protein